MVGRAAGASVLGYPLASVFMPLAHYYPVLLVSGVNRVLHDPLDRSIPLGGC